MPKIVAVHGIRQDFKGPETLRTLWGPALSDGLRWANVEFAYAKESNNIDFAFYGDLFRKSGTKGSAEPSYDADDVNEEWERELLMQWWYEASRVDPAVISPDAKTKGRTPLSVQRALDALSNSTFWAGVTEAAMIFGLKQVYAYFHDQKLREEVRNRVAQLVDSDTTVIIGHSLGSIVAYEALCAHPEWSISAFVTLGSPLGVANLIFDQLQPSPSNGTGGWPGRVEHWTNIYDDGDVVALVKKLRPLFGDKVVDIRIHNGEKPHEVTHYLTAQETGHAIANGLTF